MSSHSGKDTCFIISPIGQKATDHYNNFRGVLTNIISPVVEQSPFNLEVVRADEIKKPGAILDQIIDLIYNSKVVIADMTGQNANVMYELGIRHALSNSTILLAENSDDIPTDLSNYRTIIYSTTTEADIVVFKEDLKGHLESLLLKHNITDSPVIKVIEEKEKQRIKSNYDIRRRRWLSYARLGLPSLNSINSIGDHLVHPDPEYSSVFNLSNLISEAVNIFGSITFRSNTTSALRDCLRIIQEHRLFHKSREREEINDFAIKLNSIKDYGKIHINDLLTTDLDHPSISHIIDTTWNGATIRKLQLIKFLNNSETRAEEKITELIIEEVKKRKPEVIVLPHVDWIYGAVLPIRNIAQSIKQVDPFITVIIDGAQAVGNIPLDFEQRENENDDIDFYLGCTHKWLAGPEASGFIRFSNRFRQGCYACNQGLLSSDYFTDVGVPSLNYKGRQMGTQHRGIANATYISIQEWMQIPELYQRTAKAASLIRSKLTEKEGFLNLSPPNGMDSSIVSISSNDLSKIEELKSRFGEESFIIPQYSLPIEISQKLNTGPFFLRISPGPFIEHSDIKVISQIMDSL